METVIRTNYVTTATNTGTWNKGKLGSKIKKKVFKRLVSKKIYIITKYTRFKKMQGKNCKVNIAVSVLQKIEEPPLDETGFSSLYSKNIMDEVTDQWTIF